jgi:hypothetical protein
VRRSSYCKPGSVMSGPFKVGLLHGKKGAALLSQPPRTCPAAAPDATLHSSHLERVSVAASGPGWFLHDGSGCDAGSSQGLPGSIAARMAEHARKMVNFSRVLAQSSSPQMVYCVTNIGMTTCVYFMPG